MAEVFGISALLFGILSIFVPVFSLYVLWRALTFATTAAILGETTLTITTFGVLPKSLFWDQRRV